ncbi:urea carboxylase [Favolaschia claudopus]|uniref:Urea carboxylase n=1 Tax=Favolaschia claudopus TaxID=2862362 RepID=A0AAW0DFM9_9AGAR
MTHKLLVANRGEIAVRVIRTAKAEGVTTVAIYTSSDALSPHVSLADESIFLELAADESSESAPYLSISRIVSLCKEHEITMVHPGYGFLSENAAFAQAVLDAGIIWLGPKPDVIKLMGLKHLAREIATKVGLPCVPGSEGLVPDVSAAKEVVARIGYPVMLKASAGGGGMGMVICVDEPDLDEAFQRVSRRAKELFDFSGVFIERYFPTARHIEVQIFGNGMGDIVSMGERECSIQRRHQKIIEETPSPFLLDKSDLRKSMIQSAIRLAEFVKYSSAGTVEFLVDDKTGNFFFLEMNTRIQVEHAVTEMVHPGLDLVKLMIRQGIAEANGLTGLSGDSPVMQQRTYDALLAEGRSAGARHAIEVRLYAENPALQFRPCPGVLQYVDIPVAEDFTWLRVDSWISTGTEITPFFDPLVAKIIVSGSDRIQTIRRMNDVLQRSQVQGPPNNLEYLVNILNNRTFLNGDATTRFLESFQYIPRAMTVVSAAVEMTVQDFPGRLIRQGIPRSGPMDSLAFRFANLLVDNRDGIEGLEMIILPGAPAAFKFNVPAVVSVTGKEVAVLVNEAPAQMWSSVVVPAGSELTISSKTESSGGLRTYLAVRGGFPQIPAFLGAKSTSMGFGGYQGRTLLSGDQLSLTGSCGPTETETPRYLPAHLIPTYPVHLIIHVLAGPHDDTQFLTVEGISAFYATRWKVSPSSNRLGIRLEGTDKILWIRKTGGAGGSHPSNILDNGYALGSINVNGDTPVILTNEGPDMGGYVCLCTVASADLWKAGQLSAGSTMEFRRIPWTDAMKLQSKNDAWLQSSKSTLSVNILSELEFKDEPQDPKLAVVPGPPNVILRQAGDSAVLIEFGEMKLDFELRARIHALETTLKNKNISGIQTFCPCVRSTMIHFDPTLIAQSRVVSEILEALQGIPESAKAMTFPGRRLRFPIALNDRWCREALARYMSSIRDKAVYLPSNIDYLARNNGFESTEEVLKKLVASDWLVFGVGFYLACPFLVPIDPRCRLVAQKMNPSRTFTPRGAVGIAGVVAAIYPVVSPGGYMMYGRTLPTWQQWGRGPDFSPEQPWLLRPFDQVRFEPVSEEEYLELEKEFDAGRYKFEIEETIFSMAEYSSFIDSITEEVRAFEEKQQFSVATQEDIETQLLEQWEQARKREAPDTQGTEEVEGSVKITAPLFGKVWKILCKPGDRIDSAEMTVVILEAMKTEIPVKAGKGNAGRTVKGFGAGVCEGASVKPGEVLVVLT